MAVHVSALKFIDTIVIWHKWYTIMSIAHENRIKCRRLNCIQWQILYRYLNKNKKATTTQKIDSTSVLKNNSVDCIEHLILDLFMLENFLHNHTDIPPIYLHQLLGLV